jgi:excisionase family DNA binding protein
MTDDEKTKESVSGEGRDWMNVTEATKYLKVSRQTLYNLMDRGILPYYELKGVRGRRIKKDDLDALLRRGGSAS